MKDYHDWREETDQWIEDNPTVYALFEKYALKKLHKNQAFGVKALAERVRWEVNFLWAHKKYKLNNNYSAYIARRLVAVHPKLLPLLKFRKTRY